MTPTAKQLKRETLAAHRRGDTWGDVWQAYGANVAAAEPLDRGRYHRLVRRLLALVVTGDTAGQYPAGDDAEPWLADDASGLADSTAVAPCLLPLRPIASMEGPCEPALAHVRPRLRALAPCCVLFPPLAQQSKVAFGPTRANVEYLASCPPAVGTSRKSGQAGGRGSSRAYRQSLFCLSGFF